MRLEPWGTDDLALLEKLVGDPAMMEHLGGPESPEKVAERQARYAAPDSGMFRILDDAGEAVGSVGFWEKTWRGGVVHEVGWSVLPAYQGQGLARRATEQLLAMPEVRARAVHAFPSVDNAPSNALCAGLGFTLLGPSEFEYPPGHTMLCNDWRLDP